MQEFLEQDGYKMWEEKTDYLRDKKFVSRKYQKRVDVLPGWQGVPLCSCNDKLFLNIEESQIAGFPESYSIGMVHENRYGEWCDLKIYSIPTDKLVDIEKFESKLCEMWIAFNKEEGENK